MSNIIISPFEVYLIVQADSFKKAIIEACSIPIIISVFFTIALFVSLVLPKECTEEFKKFVSRAKWGVYPLLFIYAGFYFLTPSTKDLCYVFGIPAVVNNERVQKLAGEGMNTAQLSTEAINAFLESQIDGMKNKKTVPPAETKGGPEVKPVVKAEETKADPITEKIKSAAVDIAIEKAKEAVK